MQNFIKSHPEFCAVSLLTILCLFFLCFGLDFYPILDTQEALFAAISKNIVVHEDYNILMLNMQPFLEKPPLYFWIITQSIKWFNVFNELSIRMPNTIISFTFVFFMYYMGKTIVSRKFGLTSAIILLTSLAYMVFSHLAILNVSFIFFVTVALYLNFYASLKQETSKSKSFLWFLFYVFCGLACLTKGILGIILPFTTIIIYYFLLGKLKEIFKPLHLIPGLLVFLLITMPWYCEMYKIFGSLFIKNYFFVPAIKHFFNNIFYFGIIFIPAFLPWTIIFLGDIFTIIKKIALRFKHNIEFKPITLDQKLNIFFILYFCLTFLSISIMQKSTYSVLLLIPSASVLTAYLLCEKYVDEIFKIKIVSLSTYILATLFTVSTISFSFFYMFLPLNIFAQVQQIINFLIIGANFLSILMLLKLKNKNLVSIMFTYILSMFFILVFTVAHGFNMFYLSGENEIVKFSQYAKTKDSSLIVYNLPILPSILLEANDYVYFIDKPNSKELENTFKNTKGKVCYVILKNKDIATTQKKLTKSLYLVDKGEKYSIYSNILLPKKALTLTKFYNE